MLEAYFSTTFAVFQPAALDTMGSQIVKHVSTEKNKFYLLLFMSAHAPAPSKAIPPFPKIALCKRQSYYMKKKKQIHTEHN